MVTVFVSAVLPARTLTTGLFTPKLIFVPVSDEIVIVALLPLIIDPLYVRIMFPPAGKSVSPSIGILLITGLGLIAGPDELLAGQLRSSAKMRIIGNFRNFFGLLIIFLILLIFLVYRFAKKIAVNQRESIYIIAGEEKKQAFFFDCEQD